MGADDGWDRWPEGRYMRAEDDRRAVLGGFVLIALSGALVGAAIVGLIWWLS